MPVDGTRRFEVYKTWLGIASGTVLTLVGLLVSYLLATSANHHEAEAKRIEYRVKFYESVASDLNSLYSFVCRVGNYGLTTPSTAGSIERKMDAAFVINSPFMSIETYDAYQAFIGTFVERSSVEAIHFKFRVLASDYDKAYKNGQNEFKARGGKPAEAPPDVLQPELDEWFDDKVKPRDSAKVRQAYADLLHGFSKDSGFGAGEIDPNRLSCF
jgi:hypothetical protein